MEIVRQSRWVPFLHPVLAQDSVTVERFCRCMENFEQSRDQIVFDVLMKYELDRQRRLLIQILNERLKG